MKKKCGPLHESARLLAEALQDLMHAEGGEAGDSAEQKDAWNAANEALRAAGYNTI